MKGDIYEATYTSSNINIIQNQPLPYIQVCTNNRFVYTDNLGNAIFEDSLQYGPINISKQYISTSGNEFDIFFAQYPDTLRVVVADSIVINNNLISAYFFNKNSNNIYYHALQQLKFLNNISAVSNFRRYIRSDMRLNNAHGECVGRYIINIDSSAGRHSHVTRHELSHAYVFNKLGNIFFLNFNDDNKEAMDEAFAVYLTSTAIDTELHISPSYEANIVNYHISAVQSEFYSGIPITESFYSRYRCRYPIASAWWELRNTFGQEVFDDKLIRALVRITTEEGLDRNDWHKPRTFYNILMRYSTEEERVIIDNAYASRGLYFTPKVTAIGSPDSRREKNMYRQSDIGYDDKIYVKVTNCPQNTPIMVFIVADRDYTNGMSVSELERIQTITGRTDENGEWVSEILEQLDIGDYDIIVDVGFYDENNNAVFDGVLHFEYHATKIRDGFDGLNGPGFTVYNDEIDVVVAVDVSYEMYNESNSLRRSVDHFINLLRRGDRLNVFKFYQEQNINTHFANNLVVVNNNHASLSSNLYIYPGGGSVALNLTKPFEIGHQRFDQNLRRKGFVLFSGGLHSHIPEDPTTHFQGRYWIDNFYLPRNIKCHSVGFSPDPNFSHYSKNNMGKIAQWGKGAYYRQQQTNTAYEDIGELINSIRESTSTYDGKGVLEMNSGVIAPFVIDTKTHNFIVTLAYGKNLAPVGYGHVSLVLTSPSGQQYYNNTFDTLTRIEVDNPESGNWLAVVANNHTQYASFPYMINISSQSEIKAKIETLPARHSVDEPFFVKVSLTDYYTPINDASVLLTVSRDLWSKSFNLYDHEQNGEYSNYIYFYDELLDNFQEAKGSYEIQLSIASQNHNLTRTVRRHMYMFEPEALDYPNMTRKLHSGWNWVGYPRLQRNEIGVSIEYANASLSPYLTGVLSFDGKAYKDNNTWIYNGLTSLNSREGYKLHIDNIDNIRLFELGTLVDTLSAITLYKDQWNWVTYPCYHRANPLEALSGIIDNVEYIKSETWSMKMFFLLEF